MTNKRFCLFLFLLLLVAVAFVFSRSYYRNTASQSESLGLSASQNLPTHPLVFYDKDTFYAGVEQAKTVDTVFTDHVSGGIVPHHLFPGFVITGFFSRLTQQNPKTIILIGPNHYEQGDFPVLSSLYGWETPFGVVEPEETVIAELVKDKLLKIDENVLPNDHAVAGIMPFIKYYLPDTKVVPILLSGFTTEAQLRTLASRLQNYINKNTLIVAAVDFSHELTSPQAQEKDKTTLGLMQNFDYQQLLTLNNNYLDSPKSIMVLLLTMQALGTTKSEILYHTNSGEMQKNNSIEVTSYFSIAYY